MSGINQLMNNTRTNKPDWLEIRRSRIHGKGIFTKKNIPTRCKLGEINGDLVRLPQARKKVEEQSSIYLVELSDHLALDCSGGNSFRYLNHSCNPNCYLRIYRNRVEVYSLGLIRSGSELTIDYEQTPHKNGMLCTCGADNCRGKI